MTRVGIAVVTYNRAEILRKTLAEVKRYTGGVYEFVVADDGSSDHTKSVVQETGVRWLGGGNRGVAWNKNRALYHLFETCRCDPIILLEDDSFPTAPGWETPWLEAAEKYGHANYAGGWFKEKFVSGSGSVADPIISHSVSGQCCVFSRAALAEIGYLDPRFKGYGGAHVEHSLRFLRAGYGGRMESLNGVEQPVFLLLNSAIEVTNPGSFRDEEQVRANEALRWKLAAEPGYRMPWRDEAERLAFLAEQGIPVPPAAVPVPPVLKYRPTVVYFPPSATAAIAKPPPAPVPKRAAKPKCLIGFFGLPRSLAWTRQSIERNIYQPLQNYGFDLIKLAHFNCPEVITNPRAGEHNIRVDYAPLDKFPLDLCWREPQSDDHISTFLPLILQTPLHGEEDPGAATRRNLLQQLHSLRQLGRLIELYPDTEISLFCLLRTDIEYLDPMPAAEIATLIAAGAADLVTPAWHKFGGLNDRFAFCSRQGAKIYLHRWDALAPFIRSAGYVHSERLLKSVAEEAGLKIGFVPMRGRRVRANGSAKAEDFSI